MYDKVLVPMALDHGISAQTLEIARALCSAKGKITALHVFEVPKVQSASISVKRRWIVPLIGRTIC